MEVKQETVMGCISHHAYAKDVLVPGLVLYLWVFGCLKNCSNCMSKFLKDIKKFTDVHELIDRIFDEAIAKGINGIVISGGEPMLQLEVLEYLIKKATDYNLTSSGRKLFIHVYTGYKYEDLIKGHRLGTIISRLDILVDGEYFEELDDGKAIRGSSNQQMYFPSNRKDVIEAYNSFAKTPRRRVTVFNNDLNRFITIGL